MNKRVKQLFFVCGAVFVFLLLPSSADAQTFNLTRQYADVTMAQGVAQNNVNTFTATRISGPDDSLNWQSSVPVADVTLTFLPQTCDFASSCVTNLRIVVGGTVPAGTYVITITANQQTVIESHSITFNLTITGAAVPAYSFTASPNIISDAESTTLTWNATNASGTLVSCEIRQNFTESPGPILATGFSGSLTVFPTANTNYYFLCHNASAQHEGYMALTVFVYPNYSVTSSSAAVTIAQGTSGGISINLFTGTGTPQSSQISYTGFPAGVTVSHLPLSCTPNCSFGMSMAVGGSVPTNNYPITVSVTPSAGVTRQVVFTLIVTPAPSFTLSNGGDVSKPKGAGSVTNTITATYDASFNGTTVALSASGGAVPGLSFSFSQASCTASCAPTLTTTTTAATPIGVYTVTVTGVGGGYTRITTFTFAVTGFELTNEGDIVAPNGAGSITRDIYATFAFTSPTTATFQVMSGLPTGATASFFPATCAQACTTVLTIVTDVSTPTGVSTVVVQSTAGGITLQTSFQLTLAPPIDIKDDPDPKPDIAYVFAEVGARTIVHNLKLEQYGQTLTVNFSVSSVLPADTTVSFNPPSCTTNCNIEMSLTTSDTTPIGETIISVLAEATTGLVDETEFIFIVTPLFELMGGGPIIVERGAAPITRSIEVASPLSGVPAVSLAVSSALPSGVTASFSPSSCAPNPTCTVVLTLTQNSATIPLDSVITIQGIGGGILQTVDIPFQIVAGFELAPERDVYVSAGNVGSNDIVVSYLYGAPAPVVLSVSGQPAISAITIDPSACDPAPRCLVKLAITTFVSTAPGNYTIAVTGNRNGIVETASYNFTVSPPASGVFDYVLTSGGGVNVYKGFAVVNNISAELRFGAPSAVTFSISGLPANVSYGFSQASCTPSCTSALTLTTNAATAIGNYTLTVTATGPGGITASTQFLLSVGSTYVPPTLLGQSGGFGWLKFDPAGPYPCSGTCKASCAASEDQDTLAMCTAGGYRCCIKKGNDPKLNKSAPSYIDLSTGSKYVKGWAQFCSARSSDASCTGGTPSLADSKVAGYWDGWLQMHGTDPDFGVRLIDDGKQCKLMGWAWGSSDNYQSPYDLVNRNVGWMSFSCENGVNGEPEDGPTCTESEYGVKIDADKINFASSPSNLRSGNDFIYKLNPEDEKVELSWDFFGICQENRGFELELSSSATLAANGRFSSTIYRDPQCPVGVAACCTEGDYCSPGSTPRLTYSPFPLTRIPSASFGQRVYWHVRAKAAARQSGTATYVLSGWSPVASFLVPPNLFPTGINMILTPKLPAIGQTVTVKTTAQCYDRLAPGDCLNYTWHFRSDCDPQPKVVNTTSTRDFVTTTFMAQCLSYAWVMPTGAGNVCAETGAWQCPVETNIEVGIEGGNRKSLLDDTILKVIPEWRETIPKK